MTAALPTWLVVVGAGALLFWAADWLVRAWEARFDATDGEDWP